MKRRYIVLSTSIILLLICVSSAVYWGIYNVLPYSAIKPFRITPQILENKYHRIIEPHKYEQFRRNDFTFLTSDSLLIHGWFIQPHCKPKGTILILHGIASNKELMLPNVSTLLVDSFNVVLYDSRAHGESGGEYCTLGYYEKNDVSKCIDKIIEILGDSCAPFGIIGNSMGAAITLQAMAQEKRIVCGVSESSFADLHETMCDYLEQMIHVRWNWITTPAFARSEEIAHFHICDVSPENSACSITQPVLLIHGDADEKINIRYAHRIFDNLHSPKEFYTVHNAGHENLRVMGGEEYTRRIHEFFGKWMVR
ncbi:MAG: alpha/beta fold hydrolase [Ignavibacteriae bacterium]|nr:alpha/beta fold hydrolase [Ignavibacteriota bacterium]